LAQTSTEKEQRKKDKEGGPFHIAKELRIESKTRPHKKEGQLGVAPTSGGCRKKKEGLKEGSGKGGTGPTVGPPGKKEFQQLSGQKKPGETKVPIRPPKSKGGQGEECS